MTLASSINIALKEWDTVRDALRSGRQIILLRKGGIADRGGEFRLEHDQFLIFPTFVHQSYKMLEPEAHGRFQPASSEPNQIRIDTAALVTDVLPIKSRAQMDALDAQHIWSSSLIDMRFNYKPEKPLYLMIVRAYALPDPATIQNTPQYAGCKSWVPLAVAIHCHGATAAIDDQSFEANRTRIIESVGGAVR
jgi:hypothetical protein